MVEKSSSGQTWTSSLLTRHSKESNIGKDNSNDRVDLSQSSSALPPNQFHLASGRSDANVPGLQQRTAVCNDASTQITVTTRDRATETSMIIHCDQATMMDEYLFKSDFKEKFGSVDADIFCHDEQQQPITNTFEKKADLKQPERLSINSSTRDLAFELLNMDDWEKKIEGMDIINEIVQTQPGILIFRLHDFCISLSNEIKNPLVCVSRVAAFTMGNLYTHLKKNMDQELERTAKELLQKVGNPSASLRQDINVALDSMVRNCSAPSVFNALHSGGLRQNVAAVKACASQHLFTLVQRIDTADLLLDTNDILNRLLPIAAQLSQDASQEVRHFGRQVLIFMAPHPGFDEALRKYVPAKYMSSVKGIVKKVQEPPKMQMRSTIPCNKRPMASHGTDLTAAQDKQHSMGQEEQHIRAKVLKEPPKMQTRSTIPCNKRSMASHGTDLTAAQDKQQSVGQGEQHIGAKVPKKSGTVDADIICHDEQQQPITNTFEKKADLKQPERLSINSSTRDLAFELLNMDDWEKKIEGMDIINEIVQTQPGILIFRLHDFCISLSNEIKNPLVCVSRVAAFTMGNLYTHLKKNMDKELERTAKELLQKVGNPSASLRQDINVALDSMVRNCSAPSVFNALHSGGLRHKTAAVRACATQHLFTLVQRIDTAVLLSDTNDILNRLLPIAAQLAQDTSQEVRHFGRQVLIFMAPHPGFDEALRKYVPAKYMSSVKGIVKKVQEPPKMQTRSTMPCNKGPMASHGTRLTAAQGKQHSMGQEEQHIRAKESPKMETRSTKPGNQTPMADDGRSPVSVQGTQLCTARKEEYITALKHQMASKDFKQRMKAIDKIVSDCREEPDLVVECIFPVFDSIAERLRESNRKINQHTLEALQVMIPLLQDSLPRVLNILVPAIVDNHLNSKIEVIHRCAVDALNSLIEHLDNCLLLTALCSKAQTQPGKARGVLINMLTGIVTDLYPRKPQLVEQKVLPLLWKLLASPLNRAQTVSLCHALHAQMGQRLSKCILSQSINVRNALNQILCKK